MGYSRKNPSQTGVKGGGGGALNFQGYWRNYKFQVSIKKEVDFPQ